MSLDFVLRRLQQLGSRDVSFNRKLTPRERTLLRGEAMSGRLKKLADVDARCAENGVPRSAAPRILDKVLTIRAQALSPQSEDDLVRYFIRAESQKNNAQTQKSAVPKEPARALTSPEGIGRKAKRRQAKEEVLAFNREEAARRLAEQRASGPAQPAAPPRQKPEASTEAPPSVISADAPAPVARMLEILEEFAPARYPALFEAWLDCLKLAGKAPVSGGPEAGRLIRSTLEYRYGLFGYPAAAAALHEAARKTMPREPLKLWDSVAKLRPMIYGLLTDMSRRQFVFWDADPNPALAVVRFDDLRAWLGELAHGRTAQLRAGYTLISRAEGAGLAHARFLAAAGENLRKGYRAAPATRREPRATTFTVQGRSGREISYRPEKAWLVPIRISGGEVLNDLPDWFFEQAGARPAHQVREFYRRPPGSHPDAERSVYVSAHVRGGGAFAPKHSLPTVTVLSR